jgi:hypothetical protein
MQNGKVKLLSVVLFALAMTMVSCGEDHENYKDLNDGRINMNPD